MIFWDTNRLMCGAVCSVGVGGAVADAVIVSFTLLTIEQDLIADALPNSNIHLQLPGPCPCPVYPAGAVPLVSCLCGICARTASASRPPSAATLRV